MIALLTAGLIFDGFDLVVYGTIVPTFLRDPSQIGPVDTRMAGLLGSWALIGVLVGALLVGTFIDKIGRRKVLLVSYAWFGLGMLLTAFSHSTLVFGSLRFFTGLGVGGVLATTGALVAEYAPPHRRNLFTAIAYSGVPMGSLLAAVTAMLLADDIGWRGMMLIGALPLVTLLPLAWIFLDESPAWLSERKARSEAAPSGPAVERDVPATAATGYRGLFRYHFADAMLVGFMSAIGLLLVYALNTWLPELMIRAGFGATRSLSFLVVMNGGAIGGALLGAYLADRKDPRRVVAVTFAMAAVAIPALSLGLSFAPTMLLVAIVGIGTSGTQILIYGLAATRFPTSVRGAAVSWCAGFGRLGGVCGPLICGMLLSAGLSIEAVLRILAVTAVVGLLCALALRKGASVTPQT